MRDFLWRGHILFFDIVCRAPRFFGFICGVLVFCFGIALIPTTIAAASIPVNAICEVIQSQNESTAARPTLSSVVNSFEINDLPAPEDEDTTASDVADEDEKVAADEETENTAVEDADDETAEESDYDEYEEEYYDDYDEEEYYEEWASWDYTLSDGTRVFDLPVASHEHESQWAVDQGGIVEYLPGYYAAHTGSGGYAFFDMRPGDIVYIDGMEVTILGAEYNDYNYYTIEDVQARYGCDKVFFQTCLSDYGSEIIIVYGTAGVWFDPY